jgi:hypothetical protein
MRRHYGRVAGQNLLMWRKTIFRSKRDTAGNSSRPAAGGVASAQLDQFHNQCGGRCDGSIDINCMKRAVVAVFGCLPGASQCGAVNIALHFLVQDWRSAVRAWPLA